MTTNNSANGWAKLQQRLDKLDKPVGYLRLCDDTDVRDRYQAAKKAAEQAQAYLTTLSKDADTDTKVLVQSQAQQATDELEAAKAAYDAHTIVLRFTALERQQLEKMLAGHPPSEEDEANGFDFNEKTFSPALISAASLDGMPEEDAQRYLDTWTPSDARALWQAAWSIQHTQRTDLGKD